MLAKKPAVPEMDGGLPHFNSELAASMLGQEPMLRIRLDLAYDGAPYNGYAIQPDLPTVQGTLEEALATLIRRPVRLTVAGRTDAGVHARGQVVHFDLTAKEWEDLSRGKDIAPADALIRRLMAVLPGGRVRSHRLDPAGGNAIVVHRAAVAPPGFDARFSALWRRYSYRIADRPGLWDPLTRNMTLWHKGDVDMRMVNAAAARLVGRQDFLSFCKPREYATTIRELQRFDFRRDPDGVIVATLQADAFCHNMVRALIGGSLLVGTAERDPDWLLRRLQSRVRDSQSKLAPPHPLVLEEVSYPEAGQMQARADLTRARRTDA